MRRVCPKIAYASRGLAVSVAWRWTRGSWVQEIVSVAMIRTSFDGILRRFRPGTRPCTRA